MKPNWNDAPDWANWLAMDGNGDWFWYENKPSKGGNYRMWFSYNKNKARFAKNDKSNYDFHKSLEQRPQ